MTWLWTKTSYNCWTCGEYAVTAYALNGGWRFLAWHRPRITELGDFDTSDAAKSACVAHAGVEA